MRVGGSHSDPDRKLKVGMESDDTDMNVDAEMLRCEFEF